MKKIVILLCFILISIGINAQDKNYIDSIQRVNDSISKLLLELTTRNVAEEYERRIVEIPGGVVTVVTDRDGNVKEKIYQTRKHKFDRFYPESYIDLGYNNITGDDTGFPDLLRTKSMAFAWHTMVGMNIIKDNVGLLTGLGFESYNFRFKNDMTITPQDGYITEVSASDLVSGNVSKTKLTATYLNIPVLLKFNFYTGTSRKKYRDFFLAAGVNAGVNISSHTKIVHYIDGKKNKFKDKDIEVEPFRYGFTVRAGYGALNFFMNYYPSRLFKANEGPNVSTYVTGISVRLY